MSTTTTFEVRTSSHRQLLDITAQVQQQVQQAGHHAIAIGLGCVPQ